MKKNSHTQLIEFCETKINPKQTIQEWNFLIMIVLGKQHHSCIRVFKLKNLAKKIINLKIVRIPKNLIHSPWKIRFGSPNVSTIIHMLRWQFNYKDLIWASNSINFKQCFLKDLIFKEKFPKKNNINYNIISRKQ